MPRSLRDHLEASFDPLYGRHVLDCLESGTWPTRRGRRRISATFGVGTARGRPPDLAEPQFTTVGTERTRTIYFPPTPAANNERLARVLRRAK